MSDKTYVGNGRAKETKYGDLISFKLGPKDIKTITDWAEKHEGWCTVTIFERKEPSDKGSTHYGVLDTWEPEKDGNPKPRKEKVERAEKKSTGKIPAGIEEAYPSVNDGGQSDIDNLPF